ncbi:MAG: HAD family phosphatase [Chloroflexi bacterium]|nr:HAD family phosphatase [Chloroflexota bacterium]MBI3040404.1 HAD family phosphatase [Chloroflexota bacterium]MBI3931668.1 HAD family phosphatase [Chloroflexota bacterium]
MIRACLFDLDGTLVQTEKLKALAYAIAVQLVRGYFEPEQRAIEAYRENIGVPQDIASQYIMEKLNLEEELRPLMKEYNVSAPAQVLKKIWTDIYPTMVANPALLKRNQWPYTVDVLRLVKKTCFIAIVTGSPRSAVLHVLHALEIDSMVDLIVSGEDVTHGKPDPESYLLAARKLQVLPEECLVLEDSVNGVRAAVAAGMNVVAIATPFTNASLHSSEIIEDAWIVHEPEMVAEIVRQRVEEHNRIAHPGSRPEQKGES